ncbi:unnamed protein product [Leptidea sinapis]|uniref:Uncharacterized protein n=1 Tax=Leptidea sinapis TaxID=189913 RepID=A0A5E4QNR2_9NEOP|nr:unnamed protein product [Leptidea sinapis]
MLVLILAVLSLAEGFPAANHVNLYSNLKHPCPATDPWLRPWPAPGSWCSWQVAQQWLCLRPTPALWPYPFGPQNPADVPWAPPYPWGPQNPKDEPWAPPHPSVPQNPTDVPWAPPHPSGPQNPSDVPWTPPYPWGPQNPNNEPWATPNLKSFKFQLLSRHPCRKFCTPKKARLSLIYLYFVPSSKTVNRSR